MSREIDALIAEHVMGLKPEMYDESERLYLYDNIGCSYEIPHYSTDIAQAYKVIEHVNLLLFTVDRENCMGVRYDGRCYDCLEMSDKVNVTADTAPMAICLAILKYNGIKT